MPSPSEYNKYAQFRLAGQCLFIPTFLALYPIAFFWIGDQLDHYFGTEKIKYFFAILGLFSGFRQTYFLIKKLMDAQEKQDGSG